MNNDILLLAKQRITKKKQKDDLFCTQINQENMIIDDSDVQIDEITYDEFDDLKQLRKMIRKTDHSINQYGKEVIQLQKDISKLKK